MQRFAAGNKLSRGWAAFTHMKQGVNRSGVVTRCCHSCLCGSRASSSPLTPDSLQRPSETSRRAARLLRLRRRSGPTLQAIISPSRRASVAAVRAARCRGERRAHRAGCTKNRPEGADPSGRQSERTRLRGGLCDRSWATTLRKMRQRDRPRAHCICRLRLEQRASDSCSVSCR
jgi:hypothetical protein